MGNASYILLLMQTVEQQFQKKIIMPSLLRATCWFLLSSIPLVFPSPLSLLLSSSFLFSPLFLTLPLSLSLSSSSSLPLFSLCLRLSWVQALNFSCRWKSYHDLHQWRHIYVWRSLQMRGSRKIPHHDWKCNLEHHYSRFLASICYYSQWYPSSEVFFLFQNDCFLILIVIIALF